MYLCLCKGVSEAEVRRLARTGVTEPDALIAMLGLEDDECCGRCAQEIEEFVLVAVHEWEKVRSAGL